MVQDDPNRCFHAEQNLISCTDPVPWDFVLLVPRRASPPCALPVLSPTLDQQSQPPCPEIPPLGVPLPPFATRVSQGGGRPRVIHRNLIPALGRGAL